MYIRIVDTCAVMPNCMSKTLFRFGYLQSSAAKVTTCSRLAPGKIVKDTKSLKMTYRDL